MLNQSKRVSILNADKVIASEIETLTQSTLNLNLNYHTVSGISTNTGLLPGSDALIPTQLATKTYIDNGVTADLATHEANSTTAHFGQDLKTTGSPQFAAATINGPLVADTISSTTGVYTGQHISANAISQWSQIFQEILVPDPTFGTSVSFNVYSSESDTPSEVCSEHISWRIENASITPVYSISRITEVSGFTPLRHVIYHSAIEARMKIYIQTKNKLAIHHVTASTRAVAEYTNRGGGGVPNNLYGDDVIIFDSNDEVIYPPSSKMEAGYYVSRYSDSGMDILSRYSIPSTLAVNYALTVHDSFYQDKSSGILLGLSSAAPGTTIPNIGVPSDGLVLPYNLVVYQSSTATYGNDIDYDAVNHYITVNHAGRYSIQSASNTITAITAASDIDVWVETSPDGITWTVFPGSLRRETNNNTYKSRVSFGEFSVTPVQALAGSYRLRGKTLQTSGAATIRLQNVSQLLPISAQTTSGLAAILIVKRIGGILSDYLFY